MVLDKLLRSRIISYKGLPKFLRNFSDGRKLYPVKDEEQVASDGAIMSKYRTCLLSQVPICDASSFQR